MPDSIACQRYLQRYIAADLPQPPPGAQAYWQHCLVIPVYDETAALLEKLQDIANSAGNTLVILILNRPDSDSRTDCNNPLRQTLQALAGEAPAAGSTPCPPATLLTLAAGVDLLVYDLEQLTGPCLASQGVGLARKYGCDIALSWIHQGAIESDWLCSSDADARLPGDYFRRIDALPARTMAASLPFCHRPGPDPKCNAATALYELRLHHYVLGLEYAGSPYAFHTLGSSLAVRADAYAAVRGFPKRAGGEDFYLLNKLAKVGHVARPGGRCIELDSRPSHRVPFGTGPAVAGIADSSTPEQLPLFYHPQCFHALRSFLRVIAVLSEHPDQDLAERLHAEPLDTAAIAAVTRIGTGLGLEAALAHCRRQGKTSAQFLRQFHQWFDGFRTLKFIHAMRAEGWSDQSLEAVGTLAPGLWPAGTNGTTNVEALREAVCQHLDWHAPATPHAYSW